MIWLSKSQSGSQVCLKVKNLKSLALALALSLTQPNRSRQVAAHIDPRSAPGFMPSKKQFFFATVAKYVLHDITFVVNWHYIDKILPDIVIYQ